MAEIKIIIIIIGTLFLGGDGVWGHSVLVDNGEFWFGGNSVPLRPGE